MSITAETYDRRANLLSVPQASERLGLSPATVSRRYLDRLPFFKLAGVWRITEADLAAWIDLQRKAGAGA